MTYKGDHIIDTWIPGEDFNSNAEARIICKNGEYLLNIISDDGEFKTEMTIKEILYAFQDML